MDMSTARSAGCMVIMGFIMNNVEFARLLFGPLPVEVCYCASLIGNTGTFLLFVTQFQILGRMTTSVSYFKLVWCLLTFHNKFSREIIACISGAIRGNGPKTKDNNK